MINSPCVIKVQFRLNFGVIRNTLCCVARVASTQRLMAAVAARGRKWWSLGAVLGNGLPCPRVGQLLAIFLGRSFRVSLQPAVGILPDRLDIASHFRHSM